ncbi:MAG: aminotransferase class I/II-fold pyridoxal phosphate-dependent enzyme [Candidatus Bathyarchaeota archaeon]|nr:aminotransferase class I/II-fold pyridoxal phosphate-dependent enzyme [Candidatus Bathyarchaeota archaeon]
MGGRFIERRLMAMGASPDAGVLAMARKTEGVLTLSGGDPDFDTPRHIKEAAIRALEEGLTHYPVTHGMPALKEAIAEYHGKYGTDWRPSEVIVTAGSGQSLYASMAGTLNPGDEVVQLEPYYMAYHGLIEYLGAREVTVQLVEEEGYRLDVEALKAKVTPETKMIVLCNPSNPTGTVYTEEELKGIADVAVDNDLLVLSDEVYNELVWDGRRHCSISALPGMRERTVVSMSFSKTFAMTGWRLGCLIADEAISSRLARMPIGYRVNTFVQMAGLEALRGPWEPVEEMRREFERRRRFFVPRLNEIEGVGCHMPEGSIFTFPNIEALGKKSVEFCEALLKGSRILVRPGVAFGEAGEYHVRIPLIRPVETLEKVAAAVEDCAEKMVA